MVTPRKPGARPYRRGALAGSYLFRRKKEDQIHWATMKRRAKKDGLSIHDVFTVLLKAYAAGRIQIK